MNISGNLQHVRLGVEAPRGDSNNTDQHKVSVSKGTLGLASSTQLSSSIAVTQRKTESYHPKSNHLVVNSDSNLIETFLLYPVIGKATEIINKYPELGWLHDDERVSGSGSIEQTTTFKHNCKVVFLSVYSMAADAAYYKGKYGVDIRVVAARHLKELIENIVREKNSNFQMGLIIKSPTKAYHYLPAILGSINGDISIVFMDSLAPDCGEQFLLETPEFCKKIYFVPPKRRQKDNISCRSDAILILKDALRRKDVISSINSDVHSERTKYYLRNTALLPFMSKTIQDHETIKKISPERRNCNLLPTSNHSSNKTLQDSFDKYLRDVTAIVKIKSAKKGQVPEEREKKWQVNMYLQIKGYDLVCKAFSQLTDKSGNFNPEKMQEIIGAYEFQSLKK